MLLTASSSFDLQRPALIIKMYLYCYSFLLVQSSSYHIVFPISQWFYIHHIAMCPFGHNSYPTFSRIKVVIFLVEEIFHISIFSDATSSNIKYYLDLSVIVVLFFLDCQCLAKQIETELSLKSINSIALLIRQNWFHLQDWWYAWGMFFE
jgi:hypothetical protein